MNNIKKIEIFGDKYIVRKTFDVVDCVGGIDGFDVLDVHKVFLFHIDGNNEELVKSEINWKTYNNIV